MRSNASTNIDLLSEQVFDMARHAMLANEVPVASLVCRMELDTGPGNSDIFRETLKSFLQGDTRSDTSIIGRGLNQIVQNKDPTAHGEMLALRSACKTRNSERLSNSFLITTLEPCVMCGGAIILSRLEAVIYFAPSLTGIGMKTLLTQNPEESHAFNHYPALIHLDRYEAEAAEMLRSFFRLRRTS